MHETIPEPVLRLRKYVGRVKGRFGCPRNPCITVRDAIEIAEYIRALEDRVQALSASVLPQTVRSITP